MSTTQESLYQELLALPEHTKGEIIAGRLYVSPKPAGPHILAATNLGGELYQPFQRGHGGPGGWWVLDEPQCYLDRDVLVPDLAGWRRTRMPEIPKDHRFEVAPDWVCEIISPGSRKIDRKLKPPVYLRSGVQYLWLLDPVARELEVLRAQGGAWVLVDSFYGDDLVRVEPFEAYEIDLLVLWGEERVIEQ